MQQALAEAEAAEVEAKKAQVEEAEAKKAQAEEAEAKKAQAEAQMDEEVCYEFSTTLALFY